MHNNNNKMKNVYNKNNTNIIYIIDIIDSHDCHKRRWFVRNRFYKECEYTIQHLGKPKKGKIVEDMDDEKKEEEKEFMFKF